MAKRCDICGKGPAAGNNVSHSMRKTRRRWLPNLQSVRVKQAGSVKTMKVCTTCLKSNRVTRAA
ncbi:MAG TPA: 50S ribosomal protein L28 [Candidatus Tumulicola sp.]|jgi:large subunit ribosomal protein L28|nr:50S ribosomal protein L28 [Candidatus Tumulicola sp.]